MGKKSSLTDRISRRHTAIEVDGYGVGPEDTIYHQPTFAKEHAARGEEIQAGSWEDLYRVENDTNEAERRERE